MVKAHMKHPRRSQTTEDEGKVGLSDREVWKKSNSFVGFRLPTDLVEELDLVAHENSEPPARKKDRTWVVRLILTEGLLALREERAKREADKSKKR
jgi:hypothetical protein